MGVSTGHGSNRQAFQSSVKGSVKARIGESCAGANISVLGG